MPDVPRQTLPLFSSERPRILAHDAQRMFGDGEDRRQPQPTVYLMISGEAIAYSEDGEIIASCDFYNDGLPCWEYYAICDGRGAGGQYGYGCLKTALDAAEKNAQMIGEQIRRVKV